MTENPTVCPWCSGRGAVKRRGVVLTCQACEGSALAPDPLFPTTSYMLFGGGVQSTTLLHLLLRQDPRLTQHPALQPLPRVFLFSDTGDEPVAVYAHIERMKGLVESAGLIWQTVSRGGKWEGKRLRDTLDHGRLDIPAWVEREKGAPGRAPMKRACTEDWKILPLDSAAKKALGIYGKKNRTAAAGRWFGISTDEAQRERVSRENWVWNVYPLLIMNWSRQDCLDYLASIGETAPKSACTYCPFRSDAMWRSLEPADLAVAIAVDDKLEASWLAKEGYVGQMRSRPTLHPSGTPLRELPFLQDTTTDDQGMVNECEGGCGL